MGKRGGSVRVAVVGAGFAASFHLVCYQRIHGVDLAVVGIASRTPAKARALAEQFDIPRVYNDLGEVLADSEVNVIDLCVPVHVHKEMCVAGAAAGKHVICEKPLLGFVGPGSTPKVEMYRQVRRELREIHQAFARSRVQLLYAENWLYAPAIERAMGLIAASGGTILDIRGHEAHSGSASPFAKQWETSGGGALLRLGIHPLSAAVYLKRWEGERRQGRPIGVREVYGQTADLTRVAAFAAEKRKWLATGWQDVENWAVGVLTFEDDTVAVISASDIALGGIENGLQVYLSNARVACNITPNNTCVVYAPDGSILAPAFLNEKQETKEGWSFPTVDHEWMSGHQQTLQDLAEAVAFRRPPRSGLDVAEEAICAAYALYASAELGRRVALEELNKL